MFGKNYSQSLLCNDAQTRCALRIYSLYYAVALVKANLLLTVQMLPL